MKTKLFAITLLLTGASCLTLVSCDGDKKDGKSDKDTLVVQPVDGASTNDTTINIHVDSAGHTH